MRYLGFNEKAIRESEESFQKLKITPEQNKRVTVMSKIISEQVGISLLATKGFFWKAMKEWQLENKKPAAYILEATPEEQKEIVKQIFNKITGYLQRILKNQEDVAKLNEAMNKAYKFYLDNYYGK